MSTATVLDRWAALCTFVNPPARVVAWGGRPGIDLQVGSPRDLARARRLADFARFQRESLARIAAHQERYRRAFAAIGLTAASVARNMERAAALFARPMREVAEGQAQALRAMGRNPGLRALAASLEAEAEAHRRREDLVER